MKIARIGLYAHDPLALDTFHSFDPESFVALSMLNDGLIYMDQAGVMQPGLATSWQLEGPCTMRLTLRQGVTFHDGSPFTSRDVVETFRVHLDPGYGSVTGQGIFTPIKEVLAQGDHEVVIHTHHPDALLLHRMIFSQIYSAAQIEREGLQGVARQPLGTGAYTLQEWRRGEVIRLQRRDSPHWAGVAQVEQLEIPILAQTEWVECLRRGELDLALNLDAHDAQRVRQTPGLQVMHTPSTLSHHCILGSRGPLQDRRVRQALNMAIHRSLIVEVAEHGQSQPQASLLTPNQLGYNPSLHPFIYDPEQARQLLAQAGYADGFTLRGLVSSTSSAVYLSMRELLARIHVRLEAEIVPRAEWMRRVTSGGSMSYEGDFVLTNLDNPTLHGLFHHFIFFFSGGTITQHRDEAYDAAFLEAATTIEPEATLAALHKLEAMVQADAKAIFSVSQHLYVGARQGVELLLPTSGHFNGLALWSLRVPETTSQPLPKPVDQRGDDLHTLLHATSHLGIYFRDDDRELSDPRLSKLWRNLISHQERWFSQVHPMVRHLVDQVEAKNNLVNILGSTSRVAIFGERDSGKTLFTNEGYKAMFGQAPVTQRDIHAPEIESWDALRALLREQRAWQGPVTLTRDDASQELPQRLFLSATRATNELGVPIGYTYVFSDFSGEEERIRTQAQRRIFDHVPYGLFACDAEGRVRPGYSRACDDIFVKKGDAIQGCKLVDLLAMEPRAAADFQMQYDQLFEDLMPEELSLAQLPARLRRAGRAYSLAASTLRDAHGELTSVLFTMMDITALEQAEEEVQSIRGAMQVARDRAQFAPLAHHYLAICDMLGRATPQSLARDEAFLRRELHTFKGVFGFFELRGLCAAIHEAEEHHPLRPEDGLRLATLMRELLKAHEPVWGIRPGQPPRVEVERAQLEALLEHVRRSPAEAVALVEGFVERAYQLDARSLLGPIHETIERLSERLGKSIELTTQGLDTLISASHHEVFRVISHLIRNAVDHGVEPPEERGDKPAQGHIQLHIHSTSEQLVITLSDDGRGIDTARLIALALDHGTLSPAQAAELTHDQALRLIFQEGLSTAKEVTELSGRGVGMSAVREAIERVGGQIILQSELGRGTTQLITLPHGPLARVTSLDQEDSLTA